jgi:hypothetical protein
MRATSKHNGMIWIAMVFMSLDTVVAQTNSDAEYHSTRIGVSAGMGVNYHNAPDIVNRVNASTVSRRAESFKSGVDFFVALSVPLSRDWVAKLEYVYSFSSYSIPSSFITGFNEEFSYRIHMPTIIAQYILYEAQTYNFKVGAGAGFHLGSYDEKLTSTGAFEASANGVGSVLELEGNTALGENLYAHLGAQLRWEFVGELRDGAGRKPIATASTTLHFFSVGARLGMSYYF